MAVTLIHVLWWLLTAQVEAVLGMDSSSVVNDPHHGHVTLGKSLCFAGLEFPSAAVSEDWAPSAVPSPAEASCWGGTAGEPTINTGRSWALKADARSPH